MPDPATAAAADPQVLLLTYACLGVKGTGCSDAAAANLRDAGATAGAAPDVDRWSPWGSSWGALKTMVGGNDGRRLTGAYADVPNWMRVSVARKAKYAARHNFSFALAGAEAYQAASPWPRSWGVLHALMRAVRGGYSGDGRPCDWVWYIDLDTVITNPRLHVLRHAGVMHSHQHVFMTRDQNGLNTGSVLARCTKESWTLLDAVWRWSNQPAFSRACDQRRCGKDHPWNWQMAAMQMLGAHQTTPPWRATFDEVPQAAINSYPATTLGTSSAAKWRPGHFVVHLAGCGDQQGRSCEREFNLYSPTGTAARPVPAPLPRLSADAQAAAMRARVASRLGLEKWRRETSRTHTHSSHGAAIPGTQHASRHHATPIYRATPRLQQDPRRGT